MSSCSVSQPPLSHGTHTHIYIKSGKNLWHTTQQKPHKKYMKSNNINLLALNDLISTEITACLVIDNAGILAGIEARHKDLQQL